MPWTRTSNNLLYNGYTGEFQLIGALYRNGLDALRPPADMGVDVVTVNLKAQLQDPSVQPENAHVPGENRRGYRPGSGGGRARLYDGVLHAEVKVGESTCCAQREPARSCATLYDNRNSMLTDAYEAPFISFWIDGEHFAPVARIGRIHPGRQRQVLAITCQLREPARRITGPLVCVDC